MLGYKLFLYFDDLILPLDLCGATDSINTHTNPSLGNVTISIAVICRLNQSLPLHAPPKALARAAVPDKAIPE